MVEWREGDGPDDAARSVAAVQSRGLAVTSRFALAPLGFFQYGTLFSFELRPTSSIVVCKSNRPCSFYLPIDTAASSALDTIYGPSTG